MSLTPKQERFVDEYMIDLNATQAAIRAGYSAKTAGQIGDENLKKPQIQAELQLRMQSRGKRTAITQDEVLSDIEAIKRDAMLKIADKDGNLLMANHAAALKAAELQCKHLGILIDKKELTGAGGGPVNVNVIFE